MNQVKSKKRIIDLREVLTNEHKVNVMKYIYLSIFTLLISSNIVAQNNQKNFTKSDLIVLKELVDQFDIVLQKYYPSDNIATSYKQFLTAVTKQNVDSNIINEQVSIELIQSIKNTPLIDKIWILYTIKPKNNTQLKNPSLTKDSTNSVYIINFKGTFFNYLIKNCKNAEMKEAYEMIQMTGGINPMLLSNALMVGFTDKDYEYYDTKLAISIMFYYTFMLKL